MVSESHDNPAEMQIPVSPAEKGKVMREESCPEPIQAMTEIEPGNHRFGSFRFTA